MPVIIPIVLPYVLKYGIPVVAFGLGHMIGWFHHKYVASKTEIATRATRATQVTRASQVPAKGESK